MQPLKQTTRTHVRSTSNHLVVLGGVLRQQLSVSSQLRAYNEQEKEWIKLCEMKEPRYQHGIAVIGNFLFVVGGQVNFFNIFTSKFPRFSPDVYPIGPQRTK